MRALKDTAFRASRITAVAATTVALSAGIEAPASAAPAQTPGMNPTIYEPGNVTGYSRSTSAAWSP